LNLPVGEMSMGDSLDGRIIRPRRVVESALCSSSVDTLSKTSLTHVHFVLDAFEFCVHIVLDERISSSTSSADISSSTSLSYGYGYVDTSSSTNSVHTSSLTCSSVGTLSSMHLIHVDISSSTNHVDTLSSMVHTNVIISL
jgi:hypothetical protein